LSAKRHRSLLGVKQGCQFGFFEARFGNSGFFNNIGYLAFFENKKSQPKSGFFSVGKA